MTVILHETQVLTTIISWIRTKENSAIDVQELYREGPSHLGMSEMDLRRWINEGIRQRALTIGGLASTIEVVADDEQAESS